MTALRTLRVASCMAPNADAMCRSLADWLGARIGLRVELVETVGWAEREAMLDSGEIDLCWICGLPYIEKADLGAGIVPCVAPVMRGVRYGGRAVYFSDVVVRRDSRYARFDDLEGETLAYNEPRSHSGYNVMGYYLASQGRTFGYFGAMLEAGAHQASLELILSGKVAGAAIDTTVLDAEVRRDPSLRDALRSIETLGPSPAPPWVLSGALPERLRHEVTDALARMHEDPAGADILRGWGIAELRRVSDRDYDPIRRMARVAAAA